jgi:L-alanine-DL-glutamate epimerase-like enolase superfamily enzyme
VSRIVDIETYSLVAPVDRSADLDGSNATFVVRITDDEGYSGIGECDGPPLLIEAAFETPNMHTWSQGLRPLLIDVDPTEIASIWKNLYDCTLWHGRRGLGIHAISAIDIALHDLVARRFNIPVWKLLGGARRQKLLPYATIFPGLPQGRGIDDLMAEIARQFDMAIQLGFHAVKMELFFRDLVNDRALVECIREARRLIGPEITLMLDFGYRWNDWRDAQWVLEKVEDCDIYFAEAPLRHDDLLGHARLAERSAIRVCGAEAAATRFEIREWIEIGKVDVVQPEICRAGGFTEMRRIADMCELYGVQCIPHGWKTGITSACALHFQAACPNVPFIEYMAPEIYDSVLRRDLVEPASYTIENGEVPLPEGPGLGLTLNENALMRYAGTAGSSVVSNAGRIADRPTAGRKATCLT